MLHNEIGVIGDVLLLIRSRSSFTKTLTEKFKLNMYESQNKRATVVNLRAIKWLRWHTTPCQLTWIPSCWSYRLIPQTPKLDGDYFNPRFTKDCPVSRSFWATNLYECSKQYQWRHIAPVLRPLDVVSTELVKALRTHTLPGQYYHFIFASADSVLVTLVTYYNR
jgi:hypothetical protein